MKISNDNGGGRCEDWFVYFFWFFRWVWVVVLGLVCGRKCVCWGFCWFLLSFNEGYRLFLIYCRLEVK